jgi:hypothetical protein
MAGFGASAPKRQKLIASELFTYKSSNQSDIEVQFDRTRTAFFWLSKNRMSHFSFETGNPICNSFVYGDFRSSSVH